MNFTTLLDCTPEIACLICEHCEEFDRQALRSLTLVSKRCRAISLRYHFASRQLSIPSSSKRGFEDDLVTVENAELELKRAIRYLTIMQAQSIHLVRTLSLVHQLRNIRSLTSKVDIPPSQLRSAWDVFASLSKLSHLDISVDDCAKSSDIESVTMPSYPLLPCLSGLRIDWKSSGHCRGKLDYSPSTGNEAHLHAVLRSTMANLSNLVLIMESSDRDMPFTRVDFHQLIDTKNDLRELFYTDPGTLVPDELLGHVCSAFPKLVNLNICQNKYGRPLQFQPQHLEALKQCQRLETLTLPCLPGPFGDFFYTPNVTVRAALLRDAYEKITRSIVVAHPQLVFIYWEWSHPAPGDDSSRFNQESRRGVEFKAMYFVQRNGPQWHLDDRRWSIKINA